jgi:hypothetical protein
MDFLPATKQEYESFIEKYKTASKGEYSKL